MVSSVRPSQRHAEQANTDLREAGCDDRAAAATKGQPECADRLGYEFSEMHIAPLSTKLTSLGA
jgi:hypothetical protein